MFAARLARLCKSAAIPRRTKLCLLTASQKSYLRVIEPPIVQEINSPANSYIKHCCKLVTSRPYREQAGSVLIVGHIPVQEIAEHTAVRVLFLAQGAPAPAGVQAETTVQVSAAVLQRLSGLESVGGLQAVAEVDAPAQHDFVANSEEGSVKRLLALDCVQDPGNLGTLLRTAAGLGWDGAYLLPGCCDPCNEKALRASRGAAFKLHLAHGDWEGLDEAVQCHSLTYVGAEPHEEAQSTAESSSGSNGTARVCLVLGNESQGLSREACDRCQPLSIPMAGRMESLNVSHAGAILMFALSEMGPHVLKYARQFID
ncbi:hypothetical protein CVIRNUC_000417 [Coccomyxa viridis]|uniref:tRNA/rRNA methyltransferase SpoU type domain-containing protein n=1 Tax=Coccomyxa viridis TaxID=1274662 RepID=A0AAV1HUT5_9CHLO|nr:hypothetical protein CVIRNUC_000417 [Coccomyxa viridis]